MKKIKMILIAVLLFLSYAVTNSSTVSADPVQVSVNFQFFYNELAPYGSWVSYPAYGYVWVPGGRHGFRPYYTNGHWEYTEMGWMWVSGYDWGWAPFHYGSWVYDSFYGWVWVPGYDWAPAWVEWGSYNGYYGWAPVGPRFAIGVGYYPPIEHWCFVQPQYMASPGWTNYSYVAHDRRISISGNTVITDVKRVSITSNTANYNNKAYYAGPRREEVERVAHTRIQPVAVKEKDKPGRTEIGGNAITVYRPRVNAADKAIARPATVEPRRTAKESQGMGGRGENTGISGRKPSEVSPTPERHQPINGNRHLENNKIQPPERNANPAKEERGNELPKQRAPEQQMPSNRQMQPSRSEQIPPNGPDRSLHRNPSPRRVQPMRPPQQATPHQPPLERNQPQMERGNRGEQPPVPREKK